MSRKNIGREILILPLENFNLSNRTLNFLKRNNIKNINDILNYGAENFLYLRNFGQKSYKEVLNLLSGHCKLQKKDKKINSDEIRDSLSNEVLNLNIKDLLSAGYISVRTFNCLNRKNLTTIEKILKFGIENLINIRDFGEKCLAEIEGLFKEENKFEEILSPGKKYRRSDLDISSKEISRILKIKKISEAYKRLGTLEKVGKEFNVTRERVRQILKRAEDLGVIDPVIKHKIPYEEKIKKICTESLLKDLKELSSLTKVSIKYNLPLRIIKEKIENSGFNIDEILIERKKLKTNKEYLELVNILDHHPTTSEMENDDKFRVLYNRILRYWGTMNIFRTEYGYPIVKPGNPNIVQDILMKRKYDPSIRKNKVEKVFKLIKENPYCSTRFIYTNLDVPSSTLYIYILILISERRIIKIKKGISNYYRIV